MLATKIAEIVLFDAGVLDGSLVEKAIVPASGGGATKLLQRHLSPLTSTVQTLAPRTCQRKICSLLCVIHMVDSMGDRVGEEERREIEKEYQLKQGMKKFGKNKDLKICLPVQVGGTSTKVREKKREEKNMDWNWMVRGCSGALGLCSWLRTFLNEFFKGTVAFIHHSVKAMIRAKKNYMSVQVEMVDQQAQASQWVDHQVMARYKN